MKALLATLMLSISLQATAQDRKVTLRMLMQDSNSRNDAMLILASIEMTMRALRPDLEAGLRACNRSRGEIYEAARSRYMDVFGEEDAFYSFIVVLAKECSLNLLETPAQ